MQILFFKNWNRMTISSQGTTEISSKYSIMTHKVYRKVLTVTQISHKKRYYEEEENKDLKWVHSIDMHSLP
jgi:hypothetical protein